MPPIREHTILYKFLGDEDDEEDNDEHEHAADDDDMPPLVDAPAPTGDWQTLTHMQAQESMMSSIDFGDVKFPPPAFAPTLVNPPPDAADEPDMDSEAPVATRGRKGGRAARRAAPSYIPRPPNAFILFRSSFIRSQSVTGRVEGNHSTLSKIIGKYWHALPPEERARWEDKARAAQAEHRRRYPDWRFRPGNGKNPFTSAKPKGRRKGRIKDGGDDDDDPPDKDIIQDRDNGGDGEDAGDEGQHGDAQRGRPAVKGKGKAKASPRKGTKKGKERARDDDEEAQEREREEREKEEREKREADERCEKISDLLVEGKTGRALEAAVEEWEGRGRGRGRIRGAGGYGQRRRHRGESSDVEQQPEASTSSSTAPPVSPLFPPESPYSPFGPPASPYAPHPPPSPYAPSSPFIQQAPPHPPQSPFTASLSASPVHTPASASTSATLMLPPLTTMYKRSLSAPCGDRVALPSPVLSPAAAVPAYPPTPPYFAQTQEYVPPPPPTHGHGHVRRDTISFPVVAGGGYQHPPARRPERSPYTYPPPYTLPDAETRLGPGPAPLYGGQARARMWWDGARGSSSSSSAAEAGAVVDAADDGWGDSGVSSFANAFVPSPSPPLASPFLGHASSPMPISPQSDREHDEGAEFLYPPAPPSISRFSTLSGWAGEVSGHGVPSVSQMMQIPTMASESSSSSSSALGSGWYRPPGWENSVQGVASGSGSGKTGSPWPLRGDVDMSDPNAAWR
ncbi:hypothetical protein FB45DRAFT_911073 [Roridomyces roridus]|uniref:HMG box domain-containing protein n=1 Tax=Roridomyces roridus TaxID=1738132 RepID=A0AAD7C0D1_9AGAR|nr:hypothetical protein FB45DRAFT_911073 [Roridomyces roridus]